MQYINLNKTIELKNKIEDLLLISIDDQIDTSEDNEGIRVQGKISISGTAKTIDGNEDFSKFIDLDIFLDLEEIMERNSINISINDFTYKLDDNKLIIEIELKIEGLKEIETTFLTSENNETDIEEEIEEQVVYIDEDVLVEDKNIEEHVDEIQEIRNNDETIDLETKQEDKKSLLKSVFSNRKIKGEVSWKIHCVKGETSYEEIANKYNVKLDKLVSLNKNEKLSKGKLIFIPLE